MMDDDLQTVCRFVPADLLQFLGLVLESRKAEEKWWQLLSTGSSCVGRIRCFFLLPMAMMGVGRSLSLRVGAVVANQARKLHFCANKLQMKMCFVGNKFTRWIFFPNAM